MLKNEQLERHLIVGQFQYYHLQIEGGHFNMIVRSLDQLSHDS